MKNCDHRSQSGMTLVELLIALLISGLIISAGYALYLVQHKGWIIQEEISNAQHNVRAAIRELETEIRLAGYGLEGGIEPIYASNTDPDTIVIIHQNESNCRAWLDQDMSYPGDRMRCSTDVSCFEEDSWAFAYDFAADTGEFFLVGTVITGDEELQPSASLSRSYAAGSIVMVLDYHKFYVDAADTNHPNLMMQRYGETPQVYAEDIEDLQFSYGLANGVFMDVPPVASVVREVIITLTARTGRRDLQFEGEYRQRHLASVVKVRNLGL
jgi:prepilin-type N-terminal cleavage/methylation domain-containing protein